MTIKLTVKTVRGLAERSGFSLTFKNGCWYLTETDTGRQLLNRHGQPQHAGQGQKVFKELHETLAERS